MIVIREFTWNKWNERILLEWVEIVEVGKYELKWENMIGMGQYDCSETI